VLSFRVHHSAFIVYSAPAFAFTRPGDAKIILLDPYKDVPDAVLSLRTALIFHSHAKLL
jgi:hypothetical protein